MALNGYNMTGRMSTLNNNLRKLYELLITTLTREKGDRHHMLPGTTAKINYCRQHGRVAGAAAPF
jgi:hypothetical protein